MKRMIFLVLLTGLMTMPAFSGETTTECPMMRELNERNNPKANLGAIKPKVKKPTSGSVSQ
jgi:hypothetical protein